MYCDNCYCRACRRERKLRTQIRRQEWLAEREKVKAQARIRLELGRVAKLESSAAHPFKLTPLQHRILDTVLCAMNVRRTAAALNFTEQQVKQARKRLRDTIGVRSNEELIGLLLLPLDSPLRRSP